MSERKALSELVERVRRRFVANLILVHSAQAVSLALGGFVLLLVVGTQVLDWIWVAALLVLGAGYGLYHTLTRIPSRYRIAQRIDRQLSLQDALSTAWFFSREGSDRKCSPDIRAAQSSEAEGVAARVNPQIAEPIRPPRGVYLMASLAAVAGGLFALRYGIRGTLDLKPPIAQAWFDVFRSPLKEQASLSRKQQLPDWMKKQGVTLDDLDPQTRQEMEKVLAEPAPNKTEDAQGQATAKDPREAGPKGEALTPPQEGSTANGEKPGESTDNSEAADAAPPASKDAPESPQKSDAAPDGSPQDKSSQENSSLMDKLQDAMANLLSKFKMPNLPGSMQQRSASAGKQATGGNKEKGQGQSKRPGPGDPQPGGEMQPNAKGQEMSEGSEQGQKTAGGQGDRSDQSQASKDLNSGIGKQDGSKDLRAAQQLAAMGKISEIIGKRSQKLTGEISIEVSSSRDQKLATPYSSRQATHGSSGGEIHRDEVPLIYQHYVQQYFEQVRKMPPPAKAPGTAASDSPLQE